MSANNIGKNTVYLYVRSIVTMLISLFTSRVILDKLGVDDYGLYNTVGSITAFLSFLTSSLSLATSRFITYDLGKGDTSKLKNTFETILTLYLLLAVLIIISLEAVGPWFINNKLVFESSRAEAVNWVFHISVLTVIVSMFSAPFKTLVIAHEDMSFFAYMSIFDALAKLSICYLVSTTAFDRLIVYALLILAVEFVLLCIYILFSKLKYEEAVIRLRLQKDIVKEIGTFTGWSLLGRLSGVLQMQGVNIITNMFFGPAVVAARAISMQVNNALYSFIGNFMTAVQPQIVKRSASGDDESSNLLVQKSTIIAFILASLICFPFILNADFILRLWLKEVPQYAVIFVQIILFQSIFATIENGMYSIFFKRGRVKENALISPLIGILMFVLVYILFKNGFSPVSLSYCYLASVIISGMIVKPYLIHRIFHFKLSFFLNIFIPCIKLVLLLLPFFVFHKLLIDDKTDIWFFIIESTLCVVYLLVASYFFVLDKGTRKTVMTMIHNYKRKLFEK